MVEYDQIRLILPDFFVPNVLQEAGNRYMSLAQTVLLGAIAGFTIYLGLPVGRIKGLPTRLRSFLSMSSAGILVFLFFDIFEQLSPSIESSFRPGDYSEFLALMGLFILGFGFGLGGLIAFERRYLRPQSAEEQVLSPTRLALMIAAGIGLHNFTEGLAIGQSAGGGELAFAAVLIIGFGLHNATEGFGIVGPMMGKERPSWGFLGLAGLIGGGPTFLGTMLGYYFVSKALSVLFLSLAAGALIYIIGELFQMNWRGPSKQAASLGVLSGFLFAFMTEMVLVLAGI
jgi:ZIP family zinc transporter